MQLVTQIVNCIQNSVCDNWFIEKLDSGYGIYFTLWQYL